MKHILAGILMIGGTMASADMCDELWYTKNLLFDRAGHCFASALGRANFNNDDCIGSGPTLRPSEQAQYDMVVEQEELWMCDVDNSVYRDLNIEQEALRRTMIVLPIRDGYESACIGYTGPDHVLRRGPSAMAEQTGTLRAGGDVNLIYGYEGDWVYLNRDGADGAGWAEIGAFNYDGLCEMMAG